MAWYWWLLIFMGLFGIGTVIFFGWVGYRIKKAQKEGREEGQMIGEMILKEHNLDPTKIEAIKSYRKTGNAYRDYKKSAK